MKNLEKRIEALEQKPIKNEPFFIEHWKNGLLNGVPMTLEEVHKYSKNRFIVIHAS